MDKPSDFVPQGRFKTIKGEATVPESAGLRYVLQICDNQGVSNDDASRQLYARWPGVETSYRTWYRNSFGKWEGGETKTLQVQSDTIVVHMVAVLPGRPGAKKPKLNKEALRKCLDAVGKEASYNSGSIHLNKTAAKEWKVIEELLTEQLLRRGLNVTVYAAK